MEIAVLYGGISSEAEVSRKSGKAIAAGLRAKDFDVTEFDLPEKKVIAECSSLEKFDLVFIGYHGGYGEDGHVQAALEMARIPFTGTRHLGSALCMNKIISKIIFEQVGVPTAPWCKVPMGIKPEELLIQTSKKGFSLPVVVKPACQGSTVGISICVSLAELRAGLENAFQFGDDVIVERYIMGRELTVAVLGDEALPVIEIAPDGGFYDYEHKYTHGKSNYICPAPINYSTTQKLKDAALKAFAATYCRHYARIDFRMDEKDIYCLEVNTLPGMTDLSLVPMAAGAIGIDFPSLVEKIAVMAAN
jgi:D-alanine-D-alanine ligase